MRRIVDAADPCIVPVVVRPGTIRERTFAAEFRSALTAAVAHRDSIPPFSRSTLFASALDPAQRPQVDLFAARHDGFPDLWELKLRKTVHRDRPDRSIVIA